MTPVPFAAAPGAEDALTSFIKSPALIVVMGIVAVVVLIAGNVPRIVTPIQQTVDELRTRRRRSRKDQDDADIAEQRRQIKYLQTRVEDLKRELGESRDELDVRDNLTFAHMAWDRDVRATLVRHGDDPGTPPTLFPVTPSRRRANRDPGTAP